MIGAEDPNRKELENGGVRVTVLDEPWLYLLGILVSAKLVFGFSTKQTATASSYTQTK